MATYSKSVIASGKNQDNNQTRNINNILPYSGGTYKTISYLSRKNGLYCKAGGTSQNVTIAVYDQLINTATNAVIKTSNTATCKTYGTGPSASNYALTEFTAWTQAESNAAIAAWAAGTLQIKRIASITDYTSSGHGQPYFRDGYYDDVIRIDGTTTPFTNYRPKIDSFTAYRSSTGVAEDSGSTNVYIRLKVSMTDQNGLNYSPSLQIKYSTKSDFSQGVGTLTIANTKSGVQAYFATTPTPSKLSGTFTLGSNYYFKVIFTAGEEVGESSIVSIGMANVPFHLSHTNNGVAFGMYSNSTASKPMLESKFPAYFYGGIGIAEGGMKEIILPFDSGVKFKLNTDNPLQPTLRIFGHVVELHGEIQPTETIAGSVTLYPICTIPDEYVPRHNVNVLQQGTNQCIWMLSVHPADAKQHPRKVLFSRYRDGGDWASAANTVWLPFHAIWII